MGGALSRRSIMRLSGIAGMVGVLGVAGVQPAEAASVQLQARIRQMILVSEALALSNIGYDKNQRWSFLDLKKRRIIRNTECDCSSSCYGIAWLAGFDVSLADGCNSGNFADVFKKAKFKIIDFKKLDQVQAGDFVVGPGHVVFDAGKDLGWWSAEQDEHGNDRGGAAGNTGGKECLFVKPYLRKKGWEHIVRPTEDTKIG